MKCATKTRENDTAKGKKGSSYTTCWIDTRKPKTNMKIPKITITEAEKIKKKIRPRINRPVPYKATVKNIRVAKPNKLDAFGKFRLPGAKYDKNGYLTRAPSFRTFVAQQAVRGLMAKKKK